MIKSLNQEVITESIAKYAIQNTVNSIEYMPKKILEEDQSLIFLALNKGYKINEKSPELILNNNNYIKYAIEHNQPNAIDYASKRIFERDINGFYTNHELIQLALEKGYSINKSNLDIIINNPSHALWLSDRINGDIKKEFENAIIRKALDNNKEYVKIAIDLKLVETNKELLENIMNNSETLKYLIEKTPSSIRNEKKEFINNTFKDKLIEFTLNKALNNDKEYIKIAIELKLYIENKTINKTLIDKLQYLSIDDLEEIVKNGQPEIIDYLSEEILKKNIEYHKLVFKRGNFETPNNVLLNKEINTTLDQKQLEVLKEYALIRNEKIKEKFKKFILEKYDILSIEKINATAKILQSIDATNSLEIKRLESELTEEIIKQDNPIEKFNQIEEIFIKNNLPTVGKIYKVFNILHPNLKGFGFFSSISSPILNEKSNTGKEIIIFADLIKSFMGSNNRSFKEYLENLELGNKIFVGISEDKTLLGKLDEDSKQILEEYVAHLNTLYNNTKKGKKENNKELTGNLITDIEKLTQLFSPNGRLDYKLPDRIIKMYCHFAGIDTLEQAKEYIENKVNEADERNRINCKQFKLEKGDFVKGIGYIKYLENILQNGSLSKEFLGSSADSDLTPLDTDMSLITENGRMDNTEATGYGPIYFILKSRPNRFTITRRSPIEENQEIDTKMDLTKLEVFYTGKIGLTHYGLRTGFASSEIDYILVKLYPEYAEKIGLEIAKNGFYIPVVDNQGKLLFSPNDYDKLREKMNGLSHYGINEYKCDKSVRILPDELKTILNNMEKNKSETKKKADLIHENIEKGLNKINLQLKNNVDLKQGSAIIFNTGSTGRYTNLPGDGDFDFVMQIDREIYEDPTKKEKLSQEIIKSFPGGKYDIVNGDIREFKTKVIDELGNEKEVEIDITFTPKLDKAEYASDTCVNDRLKHIKSNEEREIVKANIILAKQFLKSIEAYKPARKIETQGGMGGIGVENWILQNGGTLYNAAKTFMEEANKCETFKEFKNNYKLYNFGYNHMALKKEFYPHDNYIDNMNEIGYKKMKQALSIYLKKCEENSNNPVLDTINEYNNEILNQEENKQGKKI